MNGWNWRDLCRMTLKEIEAERSQLIEQLNQGRRSLTVFQVDDPAVLARIRELAAAGKKRRYTLMDGTIWSRTQQRGYEVPPVSLMTEEALEDEETRLCALMKFGQGYPGFEERQALDHYSRPRLAEVQKELMRRKQLFSSVVVVLRKGYYNEGAEQREEEGSVLRRPFPLMDFIPFFIRTALDRQYEILYHQPSQVQEIADMKELSIWYARLLEWKEKQAEQILRIKPGWSAPLTMDNAVVVACALLAFLRGTVFQEIRLWPGRGEPEVLDLHLPTSHDMFPVDNVPYAADTLTAKAVQIDTHELDGMAFTRYIMLRHNYRVIFEEQCVFFLSASQPNLNLGYQILWRDASSRMWWRYS